MLPVGPIGAGNSPYSSPSSYAGSPLLVSLTLLARDGLLTRAELEPPAKLRGARRALFDEARAFRGARLRRAFERFESRPKLARALGDFRATHAAWLPDYALFSALFEAHGGRPWAEWEEGLRRRRPAALGKARAELAREIRFHEFVQYAFDRQWHALRRRCRELGIRLLGDVPMFVAPDAIEAWQSPEIFQLDASGRPRAVAGVPPDEFNPNGQHWGNPLYRWDVLAKTGYEFWVQRLGAALERFDAVRLDHFIGFHRYWSVPVERDGRRNGRFVRVKGDEVLQKVERALGGLPFVAEDLGIVTPEVRALRDRFGLPGMSVFQFGFNPGAAEHLPHRYQKRLFACTGTHDTDTLAGWFAGLPKRAQARVLDYVGASRKDFGWAALRAISMSVADLAVFPVQDVLGLGGEARMNRPGTATGNWDWRVAPDVLTRALADELAALSITYARDPRRG
jgi:4-alpha-glucanotransferase